MKLSIRHFTAAPLLILALAFSYFLVASLQYGPVSPVQDSWTEAKLVTMAFALYFFAGYWMVVARKYVAMAIISLWAWHLFVLTPYLAPCEGYRNFERFRQTMGFGVREFAIAIALVAIASSVALYLRYRTLNGMPAPERRKRLRLCVAIAAVVSAPLAAAAYWIVPLLREAHFGLGADLPTPTLAAVFAVPYGLFLPLAYWMALPLASVAGLLYVNIRSEYSEAQLRIALNGAVGLIILLNVVSSAFVVAALAPLRKLGCAV